jgi:uncharacterized protein YdhG (YjbR/CyaY superfamily)
MPRLPVPRCELIFMRLPAGVNAGLWMTSMVSVAHFSFRTFLSPLVVKYAQSRSYQAPSPPLNAVEPTGPTLGDVTVIDDHLAGLPEPQRETLQVLCDTLRRVLPAAEETISYRMPCFAVQGRAVAGFDGFAHHCSYFPHSGSVLEHVDGIPDWATAERGTLRFPIGRRLPVGLLRRLVRVRLEQIADVTDGERFEFFDDGSVRAHGRMRRGELHGDWEWFRRDGSLLRTGAFRDGRQVGTWTTHPRPT